MELKFIECKCRLISTSHRLLSLFPAKQITQPFSIESSIWKFTSFVPTTLWMSKTASASNTLTRRSEGVASVKPGEEIHITKDAWTFGILTICDEPDMRKFQWANHTYFWFFCAVIGCLLCCNAVQHGHNSDALLGGGFLCPFVACVALGPCCCAEKVRLRRHLRARYGIAASFIF